MRSRAWWTSIGLVVAAVACGDQPTEVVPEREAAAAALSPGGVALATASGENGVSITTDKDDYQPGDTVHLTGSGWAANDTLDIVLADEPVTHDPHAWWVLVNDDGSFEDSTYVVDLGDLDVTFTLTATSRTTGRSLAVQFTDANIGNDLDLEPDAAFAPRNSFADYTVTVSFGGNSTPCTTTFTVTGLSSGTTGAFTPASVTGNDGDTPKTTTLRLTTTAGTPLGPDGFTVTAPLGSGCTGNARTVGGTITVFGPPTKLAVQQQPANATGGATISPAVTVRVLDASNNLVANSSAQINLAIGANPGGGTLGGTVTQNSVNGVATFSNLSIDKVGNGYTLVASSPGLTGVTSNSFNITLGAATKLAFFTQPSGGAPGTAFATQPLVEVQDAGGNRRTANPGGNASITLGIVSGSGTGGAALTCTANPVSASSGLATFAGCRINLAGTGYRLQATSSGLTTAESDPFDVTATNQAPTVEAGGPYSVGEGAELTLAPTVNDADGDALTYKWTVNTAGIDAGGGCAFDDDTKKNAKLSCTDDSNGGMVALGLAVNDGTAPPVGDGATLSVTNAQPTAVAGGPYSGSEGAAIQLGGSGDDPGDNDDPQLGYQWTAVTTGIDAGGVCTFDNAASKIATVTCTDDGAFKVRLVVSDDDGGSSLAGEANLTLANAVPTANAGNPYAGEEGSAIPLSGSGDDPGNNDDSALTYQWTAVVTGIDPGGACTFDDATSAATTVTCTDDGAFQVRLVVTDDDGGSSVFDEETLTVANGGPVANAGGAYNGNEGSPVPLNGSVTDAGANDSHSWAWEYVGSNIDPSASCQFNDPEAEDPTITCTDNGTVQLTLTVTDDDGGSDTDQATLTLANVDPVATAGGPYSGNEGAANQLTGTASDAGSNDVLSRLWTYAPVSGVDAGATCSFLPGPTALSPTISCTDDGTFEVTLTVSDDDGGSDAADATVTLANVNPVATAGGPYSGNEGAAVGTTGTESDAGTNDGLGRQWSYAPVSGVDPGATCAFIPGPSVLSPSVSCTDDGVYQLTLTVTDDDGGSGSSDAALTIANVAPVIAAPLTRLDGSALPATLIVAGTLDLRATFGDAGSNDSHTAAIECEQGAGFAAVGSVGSPFDTGCTFTTVGTKLISVRVTDDDGDADVQTHTLTVKYNFDGFYAPVDRPTTMNVSKAGQAIPLKWRLTDANGHPVTTVAAVTVRAKAQSCTLGSSTDQLEEYAAGESGLQNLGDGRYQFNWKTPGSYAGSCKSVELVFGTGGLSYVEGPHAFFSFKK